MCLVKDEWVMVLPAYAVELHEVVLCELHALALGGHLGRRKLEELVWYRFNQPKLSVNILKFCSDCL